MSACTGMPPPAASGPAESGEAAGFYVSALPDEQQKLLQQAYHRHGLDDEIALLRTRIYQLSQNSASLGETVAIQITARLIDLLIKAIRARGAGPDPEQSILETLFDAEAAEILSTEQNPADQQAKGTQKDAVNPGSNEL